MNFFLILSSVMLCKPKYALLYRSNAYIGIGNICLYKGHLNSIAFIKSPCSSVGRSSDLKSQSCGFENYCGQEFFILYFVDLPYIYWIPKMHKNPNKPRFIKDSSKCSTKPFSILLTKLLTHITQGLQKYCETAYLRCGINQMWILKNSKELLDHLKSPNFNLITNIKSFDFSTLHTITLDLLLSIGRDGQLHTSIYDKRDDFNFHITNFPFLSSNIPSSPAYGVFISQLIRYARACSSYECFILRARRLSSKLLKQGYLVERLKSSFRKFYGRYGDLVEQYGVTLSRMLNDILTLDQQWLPYRSDFPPISWPLYRAWPSPNYEWFPWSICDGCG